jgi:hypothetical protein
LTIHFRRLLATLRLQAPASVPGAAPEGDFLDVLGRSGVDSRNVLGTLLSVMRAATPAHAYELHGVLQERDKHPRCGVTVQVVRVPTETSLPIVAWGETWEVALRKAADDATAIILPRTRRCRAPWGSWRGHAMPEGLLHAYEEATRLEQDRRYDEALHEYYAATASDPMNMVLRLRLGQMQERLGLYLDALATYCGMLVTSRPAGTGLPKLLYRGRGRRERRRALTSARYRRNVLLGGRVLADQWVTPAREAEPTKRDEQRDRLRAGLQQHLLEGLVASAKREQRRARLRAFVHRERETIAFSACAGDRDVRARVKSILEESAAAGQEHPHYLDLRDLLASYALWDSRLLRHRMTGRRIDRRTTLTPATIALTEACIRVRQRWVAHKRDPDAPWPTPPDELDHEIRRIELGTRRWLPLPGLRRRTFRSWHEHYNAACALSLPLQALTTAQHEETRRDLAARAVRRLELATARADSAYIASRRDWLVSEDPDLKGLRSTNEFKNFEVMHLPASDVTPRRPECVQQLESSRYVRALLVATAETWQGIWQRRGRGLGSVTEVREVLQWFSDELCMWEHVRAVARQYRHSGTRFELIERMRACADRYGFEAPAVGFPRYEKGSLPETDGSCDDAAEAEIGHADTTLERVTELLRTQGPVEPAANLLDRLERWQTTLQELEATAREPSRWLVAALCDHHAAMWQLLAQWLKADEKAAPEAQRKFREKTAQTRALWCAALGRWRLLSEALLALPSRGRFERPAPGVLLRYQLRSWSQARAGRRVPSQNGGLGGTAAPAP